MPVKVTLEMTAADFSWSETHYYLPGNSLQAAAPSALVLAQARAKLLGYGGGVFGVRLSSVPASRTVLDALLGTSGYSGTWTSGPGASPVDYIAAYTNIALMIQMSASSGPTKNLYLAGLPQAVQLVQVDYRADYTLTDPQLNAALQQYMAILVPPGNSQGSTSAWGYRQRNPTGPTPIIGISESTDFTPLINVTCTTMPGVTIGSSVYITGTRRESTRLPGLAGAYVVKNTVSVVGTPTFTTYTLSDTAGVTAANFYKLGQIQPTVYQYVGYTGWTPDKLATRKRGVSLGAPRGRSRRRR